MDRTTTEGGESREEKEDIDQKSSALVKATARSIGRRNHQVKVLLNSEEIVQLDSIVERMGTDRSSVMRHLLSLAKTARSDQSFTEGSDIFDYSLHQDKVINGPWSPVKSSIKVFSPRGFDEIPRAVQLIREGHAVILSLLLMDDPGQAQRAVDFVAGAAFYGDGSQERIGESLFLFAGKSHEIEVLEDNRLKNSESKEFHSAERELHGAKNIAPEKECARDRQLEQEQPLRDERIDLGQVIGAQINDDLHAWIKKYAAKAGIDHVGFVSLLIDGYKGEEASDNEEQSLVDLSQQSFGRRFPRENIKELLVNARSIKWLKHIQSLHCHATIGETIVEVISAVSRLSELAPPTTVSFFNRDEVLSYILDLVETYRFAEREACAVALAINRVAVKAEAMYLSRCIGHLLDFAAGKNPEGLFSKRFSQKRELFVDTEEIFRDSKIECGHTVIGFGGPLRFTPSILEEVDRVTELAGESHRSGLAIRLAEQILEDNHTEE